MAAAAITQEWIPDIFLSYQWGSQDQTKKLRDTLQAQGFRCWMDIDRMSGGDTLSEEIANGIIQSKVVVACITRKYTESKNCNLEINFAHNFKPKSKPIIPVLFEKIEWPPKCGMGVILGGLLYINIHGQLHLDEWIGGKFEDLLKQIRKYIPDTGPRGALDVADGRGPPGATDEAGERDVFISYHRENRKEVKKIHAYLVNKGFTCWLDKRDGELNDEMCQRLKHSSTVFLAIVSKEYLQTWTCESQFIMADTYRRHSKSRTPRIIVPVVGDVGWPQKVGKLSCMENYLYIKVCGTSICDDEMDRLTEQLALFLPDVFISYHHGSHEIVKRIQRHLVDAGYGCWYNKQFADRDGSVNQEMVLKLKNCKLFLAILSRKYLQSEICKNQMVLATHSTSKSPEIIPLAVENVKWPQRDGSLSDIQTHHLLRFSLTDVREWTNERVNIFMKELERIRGVELMVRYWSKEFSPVSRPDVQQGKQQGSRPYIKCRVSGIVPGLVRFENLRDALSPFFTALKGKIREISQFRGKVAGTPVAEVTSREDEWEEEDEERTLFCTADGEEHSWRQAGEPEPQFIRARGSVLVCRGRRTILVIEG